MSSSFSTSTLRCYQGMDFRNVVLVGDALTRLGSIPDRVIQCCVTSPPYYGLRDYGTGTWEGGDPMCDHGEVRHWDGPKQTQGAQSGHASKADRLIRHECVCGARRIDDQVGIESSLDLYIARLVDIFREVRRVLRDDGTLWLNLGDSYANDSKWGGSTGGKHAEGLHGDTSVGRGKRVTGFKAKELMGVPWRVAFALQDDGWYLRSDIIWSKGNPMPESVKDRPTRSHEYVFLFTKSERYFYDADAVREPYSSYSLDAIQKGGIGGDRPSGNNFSKEQRHITGEGTPRSRGDRAALLHPLGRNRRTVWGINPKPYKGAHFAVMPKELVRICVEAGTSVGGSCVVCGSSSCSCSAGTQGSIVLDPFTGSGTTLSVARSLGRAYLGIELNPAYVSLIEERLEEAWDTDVARDLMDLALTD